MSNALIVLLAGAAALLPSAWLAADSGIRATGPALTPAANGPYHVAGNRIEDKDGHPYLIRGTRVAPLTTDKSEDSGSADSFGHLSATTLITVRQRLNMNAVRLPVSCAEYRKNQDYQARAERVVRLANQFEMVVILEDSDQPNSGEPNDPTPNSAAEDCADFWKGAATRFRDNPNIFFAPLTESSARVIRQTGARQPLLLAGTAAPDLTDVIRQETPLYADLPTERERWPANVPVVVNGLDPEFDQQSDTCSTFPSDPADAEKLIESDLQYFDKHQISWTLSSFTAGKLITDYRYFNGTKLDAGWTCGKPTQVPAGIGMVLLSHLWNATALGLFSVSESRGGMVIARGGISTAYGPILADDDMTAESRPLPTRLGNVSIRVTDSRGVARLASLLHTGAGWAFISFVVPDECAPGPAELAVVRTDGSIARSHVIIADLAPGLFTAPPDGRSYAIGEVTQRKEGEAERTFSSWKCDEGGCRATPIHLADGVATTIRLLGTGFRYAGEHPDVQVTVGGIVVPVVSAGKGNEPGNDQITIQLPASLKGIGPTDLFFSVNREVSNVVRIDLE